jgi:hypothetical protein
MLSFTEAILAIESARFTPTPLIWFRALAIGKSPFMSLPATLTIPLNSDFFFSKKSTLSVGHCLAARQLKNQEQCYSSVYLGI